MSNMSKKIGVNLKLDVSKLDKSRFFKGAKGTYCDLTVFIDPDNPSEWGDHGIITQSKTKDEPRDLKLPICGNAKVFWQDQSEPQPAPLSATEPQAGQPAPVDYAQGGGELDTDCPFARLDDIG